MRSRSSARSLAQSLMSRVLELRPTPKWLCMIPGQHATPIDHRQRSSAGASHSQDHEGAFRPMTWRHSTVNHSSETAEHFAIQTDGQYPHEVARIVLADRVY